MESNADTAILGLWQQQAGEVARMPLDEIRTGAGRLDAKSRRMRVWMSLFFILVLIKGAVEVWLQDAILERAGDLLLMAAWVYVAYRYRKYYQAAPPMALGRTNCVDFYRAELVRQRDLSQDGRGFLLPFVPGMAIVLLDGVLETRSTSQLIALVVGGVGVFVGIAWWNAHTARKLQREIDALEAS